LIYRKQPIKNVCEHWFGISIDGIAVATSRRPSAAAAIENHDGSRLETQAARHAAFTHAAFGDERKTGEQSLMIKRHSAGKARSHCPETRDCEQLLACGGARWNCNAK
jgi:diaminopimelate epimerase